MPEGLPTRETTLLADLHIHSCLSPCADIDVSPATLARRGAELGLNMMALTDHNSSLNCPAFALCCERWGIIPVFGMELTTAEEVHLLCLFGDLNASMEFHHRVHRSFPHIPLNEDMWNPQYVVDHQENVIDQVPYLLTSASTLSLTEAVRQVHSLDGLAIPAHIDRSIFSLYSQLGFMTNDPFDGVEITLTPDESELRISRGSMPCIADSDCHQLSDLAQRHTRLSSVTGDFSGLQQALKNRLTSPVFTYPGG